jgi:UDP-glucuronate 4-epimerase
MPPAERDPSLTGRASSTDERFLVTGAMGCIGAWTVHELLRAGASVVAFDRSGDPRRLRTLLTDDELARVTFVTGDITDGAALGAAMDAHAINHVIHLAALQVPFCRADPVLGAQVNVVGTVVLFEQVRQRREWMAPVVYAGSIGMFDAADADSTSHRLLDGATAHPANLYGVYKLANEGTARVFWQDHGVASFGLRPMTVYGPGRDQGMTSAPTKAMVAAVLGRRFHVPFGGSALYQYAPDVARTFLQASRAGLDGALTANLGGTPAQMDEVVSLIERYVPAAAGTITHAEQPLPFPDDIDSSGLAPLGPVPITPLADGVARTIARYREMAVQGQLVAEEQGLDPA